MKIPSINFNEGGRFFTFAFNYVNIFILIALAIPYPWYGTYRELNRFTEKKMGWHLRYKVLEVVIYKKK